MYCCHVWIAGCKRPIDFGQKNLSAREPGNFFSGRKFAPLVFSIGRVRGSGRITARNFFGEGPLSISGLGEGGQRGNQQGEKELKKGKKMKKYPLAFLF